MSSGNLSKLSIDLASLKIDLNTPMTEISEPPKKTDFDNQDYDEYQEKLYEGYYNLKECHDFIGEPVYRMSNLWEEFFPIEPRPIRYLEIGAYLGANAISMAYLYCHHKDSEIHCVDPWNNYENYEEYKTSINEVYYKFLRNISNRQEHSHKFHVYRNYSSKIVPIFDDEYFDIIYIDGNHNPEYVIEDAVLAFNKLKIGGYLIFDDDGWNETTRGIDAFDACYSKYVKLVARKNCQRIYKKNACKK